MKLKNELDFLLNQADIGIYNEVWSDEKFLELNEKEEIEAFNYLMTLELYL